MDIGQQNENKMVIPSEFIGKTLELLPERAKAVLVKRFDLDGSGRKTLEEAGESFQITRERVRQIEKATIEKIKAANTSDLSSIASAKEEVSGEGRGDINEFSRIFSEIIVRHGGIMEREFFLAKVLEYFNKFISEQKRNKQEKQNIILILRIVGGIKQGGADGKLKEFLFISNEAIKPAESVISECEKVFAKESRVMDKNEIFIKAMREESLSGKDISEDAFYSYLHLPQSLGENAFGEWGLVEWPAIFPKSVKDKSYLIMLHEKKPMHFKEIAALIERTWKKKKPILPETVHNELIKNQRFVLIGRGIYALAEWGYERGAVRDIIKSVLAKAGRAMDREEIIKEVMLQRLIKTGTIALNLKDEKDFVRTAEGLYKLKVKSS